MSYYIFLKFYYSINISRYNKSFFSNSAAHCGVLSDFWHLIVPLAGVEEPGESQESTTTNSAGQGQYLPVSSPPMHREHTLHIFWFYVF